MRQLLLDLGAEKPQSLDTFVTGKNDELVQLLQRLANRAATALTERFVYLWGEPGAGKTHLLKALAATSGARYIEPESHADGFLFSPEITLYLIDDCQALSCDSQIAAFNLFNQARFTNPSGAIGTPNFGRITSALDGRVIQLGIKLLF